MLLDDKITKKDGTVDPYKLTFILKEIDNRVIPDAKNRYINFKTELRILEFCGLIIGDIDG